MTDREQEERINMINAVSMNWESIPIKYMDSDTKRLRVWQKPGCVHVLDELITWYPLTITKDGITTQYEREGKRGEHFPKFCHISHLENLVEERVSVIDVEQINFLWKMYCRRGDPFTTKYALVYKETSVIYAITYLFEEPEAWRFETLSVPF